MGMVADTGICQVSNTDFTAYCTMPRDVLGRMRGPAQGPSSWRSTRTARPRPGAAAARPHRRARAAGAHRVPADPARRRVHRRRVPVLAGAARLRVGPQRQQRRRGPGDADRYRFIVDDPIFRDAVKHNLLLLLSVPVVLVLALAIAFVLHEGIRGWRVYRTIIFLPYMLAIPVLGTTFVYLLSLNGVVNTVFGAVGLGVPRSRTGSATRRGC